MRISIRGSQTRVYKTFRENVDDGFQIFEIFVCDRRIGPRHTDAYDIISIS